MRITRLFTLAALLLLIPGLNRAYAQKENDYLELINRNNALIREAILSGKMETTIDFYADDVISMPPNSPVVEGIDAIREHMAAEAKSDSKVEAYDVSPFKVTVCDNRITEAGTYRIVVKKAGMEKPLEMNGKYVTIWEDRGDKNLKIKLEIWNADPVTEGQSAGDTTPAAVDH